MEHCGEWQSGRSSGGGLVQNHVDVEECLVFAPLLLLASSDSCAVIGSWAACASFAKLHHVFFFGCSPGVSLGRCSWSQPEAVFLNVISVGYRPASYSACQAAQERRISAPALLPDGQGERTRRRM